MSLDVQLHNAIERNNILSSASNKVERYFDAHPTVHKIALLMNHIFRAIGMMALQVFLPFTASTNLAVCFAGSLFYRLTVERGCAYKFALPSFFGSLVLPSARKPLVDMINGVAFASMNTFTNTFTAFLPALAYFSYIVLTVNYDVDH